MHILGQSINLHVIGDSFASFVGVCLLTLEAIFGGSDDLKPVDLVSRGQFLKKS